MAATVTRLFDELSTARRPLDALAAAGFQRDGVNLIAHQERIDTPEAIAGWTPRLVTIPGLARSWRLA
jgi:hypothetical protein